ncbi:hypothetical protein BD626DRAFT_108033 [Schizophyllum amplum]|uniref:Uncharacterized protein n=1 Tax=Schizophyllum amplum TaxID=97359 RepID=A0A550CT24_9AGAR|nr:hypothetical protein BD626DRAFT_108033 [Auriculariopsis ampla]
MEEMGEECGRPGEARESHLGRVGRIYTAPYNVIISPYGRPSCCALRINVVALAPHMPRPRAALHQALPDLLRAWAKKSQDLPGSAPPSRVPVWIWRAGEGKGVVLYYGCYPRRPRKLAAVAYKLATVTVPDTRWLLLDSRTRRTAKRRLVRASL